MAASRMHRGFSSVHTQILMWLAVLFVAWVGLAAWGTKVDEAMNSATFFTLQWRSDNIAKNITNALDADAVHEFSQLVRKHAVANEIIISVATYQAKDFLLNLLCSLKQQNITNFVVGALDKEMQDFCLNNSINVYYASSISRLGRKNYTSGEFGTESFNKLVALKHESAILAMSLGYNVIVTDLDIVWLRNPLPLLRETAGQNFDIVFQCDNHYEHSSCYPCGGFFYARPTEPSIQALDTLVNEKIKNVNSSTQDIMKKILCKGKQVSYLECKDPETGIRIRMLSKKLLPNGNTFMLEFKDRVLFVKSWNPYIMHFNWMMGDENKIQWMKKAEVWFLNEKKQCTR